MNLRPRCGRPSLGLAACLLAQGVSSRAFAQQAQQPPTQAPAGQDSAGQDQSAQLVGGGDEAKAGAAEANELEALLGESVVTTASRSPERGSFNYSHTRRDGKPLPPMPPLFGNARIAWQLVPDGVTIAAAAIVAGERKVIATTLPTSDHIGRQFDLRTTLSGPTGIAGLKFRASLTYVLNPLLPYSLTWGEQLTVIPVVSRLYGFVGLEYDFDLSARGATET
jgi:hypothetical protein